MLTSPCLFRDFFCRSRRASRGTTRTMQERRRRSYGMSSARETRSVCSFHLLFTVSFPDRRFRNLPLLPPSSSSSSSSSSSTSPLPRPRPPTALFTLPLSPPPPPQFFRTGDLLYRTSSGLWYFADRLGDSYRWKSENVSTTEVAEKLGAFEGLSEVNVYGVLGASFRLKSSLEKSRTDASATRRAVPGNDGRAGCAAIPRHVASQLDFDALAKHVQAVLPKYAQPVFLRVVPQYVSFLFDPPPSIFLFQATPPPATALTSSSLTTSQLRNHRHSQASKSPSPHARRRPGCRPFLRRPVLAQPGDGEVRTL